MAYQHIVIPESGQKVTVNTDCSINVPNNPVIPFIEGDGIGTDITPVMLKVIDHAVQKAYGDKKKINWEALVDQFVNEERGNRRETTKGDLRLRMKRALQALNTKPLPRTGEQLFKNYADLFFNRTMPKGGVGRKRNMGDLRAFLNWCVLERKYLKSPYRY